MKLWSFQPQIVFDELLTHGTLEAKPHLGDYINQDGWGFEKDYTWMENQYKTRKGHDHGFLWWAYPDKPDLRYSRHHLPDGSLMLHLEVPDEDVLIFDNSMWNIKLNGHFLAKNEWEYDYFSFYEMQLPEPYEEDCVDRPEFKFPGPDKGWPLKEAFDIKYSEDELFWKEHYTELITQSWEKMFDPDFIRSCDQDWIAGFNEVVFRPLKLEYVKKVSVIKNNKK